MTNQTADVVVVGGGVIGTSIAMHLAMIGSGRVVLVEQGHLAGGASGLSGAMVREHYLHPTLVRMSMEARSVFHNFAEVIGGDVRFRNTGRLQLFPEHDEPAVRANVAMNRDLGVNIEMLTPSEATHVVPQLDVSGIAVCGYEPDAGYADPVATTYAYADRARTMGAEIITQTPVNELIVSGGRITAVETAAGRIETGAVVVAAGSRTTGWSAPHRRAGADNCTPGDRCPISRAARAGIACSHMYRTAPRAAYLRETHGRSARWGGGPGDLSEFENPDDIPRNAEHEMIESLWRRASTRLPDFAAAICRGGYSAHYDMTPDGNPIIDRSASVSGLFYAAGFSGHGFKLSPVIGRMVAELVLHGECSDHPVERFRLSRFADGDPLLAEHPYQGTSHQ